MGADSFLALVAPDQRAHVAQALSGLTANAPAVALETPLHLEPAGTWKLRAYLFGESDDVVVTVEPPSPAASTELSAQGSYEHRFRTMAHGVHDAIWEWDCESGALFWHAGLHDVLGYDKGTLDPTLDAWAEHVHPDDRERVVVSLHNAVEMGQSAWVEEYRFRRADGSWAQVVDRGFAIAFEGDRPTRLIGGINDVTASRQASATIRRQARLIEQTHDAIWVRDFDGIVRFWNPGAERIFGKSRENVVGRALREHESNTDTPTLEGLKRRGSWSGVVHRYDRQGNEVILEERWTLLRDEHDEPHAILIVGSDITERHHLQSQFLRIQRVESMGSVAAGIAHDLNNVLAPIHFGVEYLRGELAHGDTTLKEVLDEVAGSVRSASSMLHHILNFARGNDATREALDLHRLVSDALRIVTRGHAHRISTRIHNDAPSDRVMGVPTQIHQLLLNLGVNARDAIDGEGSIEVHLREASVTPEQAEQNPDARPGDYLRIDVRDNGRGMSADVIVRVFEPFYTTKGVNQGTGIGLSTSISIVRSHGGFIDVESAPGEGTLFSVFLPIAMEASRSAEPPSPSPVSPAEGRDPS
ncbi:PAS domain-containing sensor histidine kinase [Lujinxingia vulgaris]|uniref:PAS domain-containing sensor histidine kinase n=1 Tax=Lujinxingia vulgaris TaxID=2600176 RepID=UPI001E5FF1C4|nr:PAS domain-containing sensor histidine kinase [Lujinxingia vulgaris]